MSTDQTFRFRVGSYYVVFTMTKNSVLSSIEVKVEW